MSAAGPAGDELEALIAGTDQPLVVRTRGALRFLIFNRPRARNALSREIRIGYARELQAADQDPTVAAVIVTGANGCFSAGVDVKENPPGVKLPIVRPHPVEATRAMSKPVIAMVDGPCVTGGLEVAMSCSFAIASTRASFADTHIKIGIFPGWGLTSLLASAIGARRAAQMQMSGEFIDAQRAFEWGLVNEVVPPEALFQRTCEIADRIGSHNPDAIHRYVALNRALDGETTQDALAVEQSVVEQFLAGA